MVIKFKLPKIIRSKNERKFKLSNIFKIIISLIIFLIIFRLVIVFFSKDRLKKEEISAKVIPVEVRSAHLGIIRDIFYLTGWLQAESEVQVFSPISGWLDKLYVDIGSKVFKRSTIASIDRNIIGSEYTKALVQAPISGEVGRIYLDVGSTVAPNTPIMTILNYDNIKVELNIPEKYINRVKLNDTVLIQVEWTNEEFIGKIAKKSETIDSATGTFKAKVTIPNRLHKLKPGAFAKIRIVLETRKAVIIPKESIIEYEGGNPFVFKITNNIAKKVYVRTGITEETNIEILSGIKEGDILITVGKEIVYDGAKVKVAGGSE